MKHYPENLTTLNQGEDFIRSKSIEAIDASDSLKQHIIIIEHAMDVINYFSVQYSHSEADLLTVQLLGIRLFNAAASALKLQMSGYYQTGALQQRDMLETLFLLDYFRTDSGLIGKWRDIKVNLERNLFKPYHVRNTLDKRDGFTTGKREEAYKLLCELAGHPTNMGFRMLAPEMGGNAHCGPFFEYKSFEAVTSELAKHLVQAARIFVLYFQARSREEKIAKVKFLEAQSAWIEFFWGKQLNKEMIDDLKKDLSID